MKKLLLLSLLFCSALSYSIDGLDVEPWFGNEASFGICDGTYELFDRDAWQDALDAAVAQELAILTVPNKKVEDMKTLF